MEQMTNTTKLVWIGAALLGLALGGCGADSGGSSKTDASPGVGADTAAPAADEGASVADLPEPPADPGTSTEDIESPVEDTSPPPADTADPVPDTSPLPDLEFDESGCLTYAGASALCGAKSDGSVCALAATCREDGNASQCSIDCEMSPTGLGCIEEPAVECVVQALAADDCPALAECAGWFLVY